MSWIQQLECRIDDTTLALATEGSASTSGAGGARGCGGDVGVLGANATTAGPVLPGSAVVTCWGAAYSLVPVARRSEAAWTTRAAMPASADLPYERGS